MLITKTDERIVDALIHGDDVTIAEKNAIFTVGEKPRWDAHIITMTRAEFNQIAAALNPQSVPSPNFGESMGDEAVKEQIRIDEANRRAQLEEHGLWDEFGIFGCDTIDHLADALVAARQRISRLRLIGAQMANVCYNVAERPTSVVSAHERQLISELYKKWDEAVRLSQ